MTDYKITLPDGTKIEAPNIHDVYHLAISMQQEPEYSIADVKLHGTQEEKAIIRELQSNNQIS